ALSQAPRADAGCEFAADRQPAPERVLRTGLAVAGAHSAPADAPFEIVRVGLWPEPTRPVDQLARRGRQGAVDKRLVVGTGDPGAPAEPAVDGRDLFEL